MEEKGQRQKSELPTHNIWEASENYQVQQLNDYMKFSNTFPSIFFCFCLHLEKLCAPLKKNLVFLTIL